MQYISSGSRAPRKQLATKAAQIYGAEDYSDEENDSEVERSKFQCNQPETLDRVVVRWF